MPDLPNDPTRPDLRMLHARLLSILHCSPGDASDWWGEQDVPGMCASFARAFLLSVERADRAEEERDRLAALLDARGRLGARADNP